jgi:hypothetical protein
VNAITGLSFAKIMDVPDHLTTLRGKGGFGTSSQALMDVFFQLTSSESKGRAIQTLMRFYISNATPTAANKMMVTQGYPMNTYSEDNKVADTAKFLSTNNGQYVLSTGLKVYFNAGDKALDNYYGFYVPRMTPFFSSKGGNQIDVMVSTTRKVECFSWGSYNGAGMIDDVLAEIKKVWGSYFLTNGYLPARMVAGLNLVICKATKGTAGTAKTGDVVVVPATQSAPDVGSNDPAPGQHKAAKPYSSSRSGLMSGLNKSTDMTAKTDGKTLDVGDGKEGLPVLAGSDAYLGTMSHLSDATIEFNTLIQADEIAGSSTSANGIPASFAKA